MKRFLLPLIVSFAFGIGLLASPAMATSYPGPWASIFGHSTSCALGRASINNDTIRGGALTENHEGCHSYYDFRSVPAGYLGSEAFLLRASDGAVCGHSTRHWNSSTASSQSASTGVESTSCNKGDYAGYAYNLRKSDAGDIYAIDRLSPVVYLNFLWA